MKFKASKQDQQASATFSLLSNFPETNIYAPSTPFAFIYKRDGGVCEYVRVTIYVCVCVKGTLCLCDGKGGLMRKFIPLCIGV